MNDTFSYKRFGLLFKKIMKENFLSYLLYIAAMCGILFLVYGFTILVTYRTMFPTDGQMIFFLLSILFGSTIFSASFYGFFQNKAKGIQYLNLPASNLEKMVLGFLITQVMFFVSYFFVFMIVDRIMCGAYNHFHVIPARITREYYGNYTAKPLDFTDATIRSVCMIAFVLSAICHFGSLIFEKAAFIKIGLIVIISGVGFIYFSYTSLQAMIPEESMPTGLFYSRSIRIGTNEMMKGSVRLPESWGNFIYWFFPGLLYALFWTGSYFKLKEKQV